MSLLCISGVRSVHMNLRGSETFLPALKSTSRRAMTTQTSPLELKLSRVLEKRRQESRLRVLNASPPNSVDFSSNDFLSLATSSKLRETYLKELQSGPSQIGSTGSRLLDGNSKYAEKLEKDIARFHGGKAGLLTNSGFDANVSIFTCLPQPGDIIVYDELIHASVHDGMRQSRASETFSFSHNSVRDLRRQLLERLEDIRASSRPVPNVFIAVESVYSMEGDVAPLKEMVETVEELFPNRNAHVIVDEAHSNGVYGAQGKGLISKLGLEDRIFVRLHTFGKALACNGSVIICSETTRSYLINYARPLIYTTFMSFPSLAAIKAVYGLMTAGETMPLASRLFELIDTLHVQLQRIHAPNTLLTIPFECPKSPIFALLTPHARELAKHCQDAGFVVRAVVPPTVPMGTERVRVCLHTGNTEEQIDGLVRRVESWVDSRIQMKAHSDIEVEDRDAHVQLVAKL